MSEIAGPVRCWSRLAEATRHPVRPGGQL